MPVKEKIRSLLAELNKGIYEKEEIMALALLSAVAGESVFLLGPPGVAKSLIARRLKYAFQGGRAFEYLMHRFSTPDEIFGPVSIAKLKDEEGKYERLTEGYLPDAEVVFLDEIWKAGPGIQNTLLTVLNEKIFRNGTQVEKLPLKALISASNELPAKDQGLEALWDRFLLRLKVDNIKDMEKFEQMICETQDANDYELAEENKITLEEYDKWKKDLENVKVPENVLAVIKAIKEEKIGLHNESHKENEEEHIYVSDRRWRKIVRLLRASAFLNDRQEVDLMDCFLIRPCLWDNDGQIDDVHTIVVAAVENKGYTIDMDFESLRDELKKFKEEIKTKLQHTDKTSVLEKIVFAEKLNKYPSQNKIDCYKLENDDYFIIKDDFDRAKNKDELAVFQNKDELGAVFQKNPFLWNLASLPGTALAKATKISDFYVHFRGNSYSLESRMVQRDTERPKKIHKALEEAFDGKFDQMKEFLAGLEVALKKHKDALKHLRGNLFVDPDLAKYPEHRLYENEDKLKRLRIEIDETQASYKA